jgi:hypothetical protein
MSGKPQPEVFTQGFKLKGNIIVGCSTLLLFFVPFVGGLLAAAFVGETYGDAPGIAVVVVALILTGVGLYLGHQKVFLYGNSGLRRDLATAIQRRLGRNPDDGTAWFVGFTQGAAIDPMSLDTDNDIGFLSLEPEKMTYVGDTVAFELWRQQVYEITLQQQGIPIIWDFGKRVRVRWADQYGRANSFTFERREGSSKRDVRRKTKELTEILQQWHQFGTVPSQALPETPPPPPPSP